MTRPGFLTVAALVVALTSCGGSDGVGPGGGGGGGGGGGCIGATFCATNSNTFSPASATVASGTVVSWTNKSSQLHNVTFDDPSAAQAGDGTGSFDLNDGATHTRKFTTGATNTTYAFHCTIHQGMNGNLVVTP